jgi:hypothetical protein
MKKILLITFSLVSCMLIFSACKKDLDENPTLTVNQGTFTTAGLTATSTTLTLDSVGAATKNGVTLTWQPLNYGADLAVTYTLQIDSVNGGFAKPLNLIFTNAYSKSYTVAELNTLATVTFGLVPGTAGKIRTRVKVDVNQSTGSATTVPTTYSNTVELTITPYSTKPVPKYPVPAGLFLVGSATPGGDATGWNNPVPVPSQKFTQIDETSFGIVINMVGGKDFLLLPVNGDWSHKYAITGTANLAGGDFVPDANNNMKGPATSGLYKIIVDFVKGTYAITPATAGAIPTNLYIVGDATAGQWNNPVPTPSQEFTRVSSGEFELTVALTSGKSYLFLPLNGDWTNKYGGTSKTGGELLANGAVPGSNTPAPDASGTYKINVNFFSSKYTVKP